MCRRGLISTKTSKNVQNSKQCLKCLKVHRIKSIVVNFPITAGWMPNKQFCLCKLTPFGQHYDCSQVSGQAMVDLKLWSQSDLLNQCHKGLQTAHRCSFLFYFSLTNALFFVTDHTTKLRIKDLLKDQQW